MADDAVEEEKPDYGGALAAGALGAGTLAYGAHHALKDNPGIAPKTKQLIGRFLALKNEKNQTKQVKNYAQYGSDLINSPAFGTTGKDIILGLRRSKPFKLLEQVGIARKFTPGSAHHYNEFARGGGPALTQLRREVGRSPAALSEATRDALKSYSVILKGALGADTALKGVQRFGRYGLPLAGIGAAALAYRHHSAKKQEGQADALREYGLPDDHLG